MLLTLDPGITTGWALLLEGTPAVCGVIPFEYLDQGLAKLAYDYQGADVVIEHCISTGASKLALELQEVLVKCRQYFPKANWIMAGHWKPVTGSVPLTMFKRRLTTHERDAVRMGIWWTRKCAQSSESTDATPVSIDGQ